MTVPRWLVYPAVVVLAVLGITAIPGDEPEDPYLGAASGARDAAARGLEVPAPSAAPAPAAPASETPTVVVLGIDGLDPDLLLEMIEEQPERVPNFKWLHEQASGVQDLTTSIPPQSPVAWSNFSTGRDPGGHGVFDFIHRDLATRGELPPTVIATDPTDIPLPGKWKLQIPGSSEEVRQGDVFWEVLARNGVPADIWRIPANFPAEPAEGLSFSGMMTPVLDGTYGGAMLFTEQATEYADTDHVRRVEFFGGKADSYLEGPPNAFQDGDPKARTPVVIYHDEDAGACAVDTGTDVVILQPGQWSEFVQITFSLLPAGAMDMVGSVRFYLRSFEPFELYSSPINIDASVPATPVAEPSDASADLAEVIGLYYTQGMPDDVGSLKTEIISDGEFLEQVDLVYEERNRMLDYALDHYQRRGDGGLLFFYYSTVDLASHMMWRHSDAAHPHHVADVAGTDSSAFADHEGATWATTIYDVIAKVDPALGEVREALGDDVTIIVMSDHGFAPYRWKFNLNAWLHQEGYLVLRPGAQQHLSGAKISSTFTDANGEERTLVDWAETKAYGIGFNGLYLNLADREKDIEDTPDDESGVVAAADADALLAEIVGKLEAYVAEVVHPVSGEALSLRPVLRCDYSSQVYDQVVSDADDFTHIRDGGPDVIVGYDSGWGNSDEATQGELLLKLVNGVVVPIVHEPNEGGTFNGSHLMAPEVVPGTLLSNRTVRPGTHGLTDLAVEVLKQFDVEPEKHMNGHAVLD